jgi:hypothetical protein
MDKMITIRENGNRKVIMEIKMEKIWTAKTFYTLKPSTNVEVRMTMTVGLLAVVVERVTFRTLRFIHILSKSTMERHRKEQKTIMTSQVGVEEDLVKRETKNQLINLSQVLEID